MINIINKYTPYTVVLTLRALATVWEGGLL